MVLRLNRRAQTLVFILLSFAAGLYAAPRIEALFAPPAPAPVRTAAPAAAPDPVFFDFALPESLMLCEERGPLHHRRVWEMLDREFNIAVWNHAQIFMYLKRAGRYFPYIEKKLAEAGLPEDLKYLAVAESALITRIDSHKGARGPWQFMTAAARSNGLRRDGIVDERLSFERSTEAAIGNLKRLYTRFGSWSLAMAAYNGGETRLSRAIRDQKTRDYYRLSLPLETERYVFRIAAIKIIMENPERYGYYLSSGGRYAPKRFDVVRLESAHSVPLLELAEAIGTDFKSVKELNPQFLRDYVPRGTHTVYLPPAAGIRLVAHLAARKTHNPRAVLVVSDRRDIRRH
jgi:soluble lytic murein transglycosylase-like protein